MKIENITESTKFELIKSLNDHWKKNHILVRNSDVFDLQHKNIDVFSFLTLKVPFCHSSSRQIWMSKGEQR